MSGRERLLEEKVGHTPFCDAVVAIPVPLTG